MIYHQISSVAVCEDLTEFLDNIFKMPIFKPRLSQIYGLTGFRLIYTNTISQQKAELLPGSELTPG